MAKQHERKIKPSEAERLAKGRALVAAHLVRTEGMEPELAASVVEGLEADEINRIIEEANTTVIEADKAKDEAKPEGKAVARKYEDLEVLTAVVDFPELVKDTVRLATVKNRAEKAYKAKKAELWALLGDAGVHLNETVDVHGIRITPYMGNTPPQLDKMLLLEKGVSIDIINACWKKTAYSDIRLTVPKELEDEQG